MSDVCVAVCAIGLEAYWAQFSGLRARLDGNLARISEQLEELSPAVVSLGMVDSIESSRAAGDVCRRASADLLLVYVATYALSSHVLPMVQRAGVPVLVLNLQPEAALDYSAFNALESRTAMTGEWLAYCSACPVPEIANVFQRAGIPLYQITGVLTAPDVWLAIEEWVASARVRKALANATLGLMGHYYSGMLDIATDLTQVGIVFGTHIEQLELDELSRIRLNVSDEEVVEHTKDFRNGFEMSSDCEEEEVAAVVRTSIALERFLSLHRIDCLAYYAKGSGIPENEETMRSIIPGASLLTAKGIPVAGEYEVKNVLAMKVMESLGAGGSFSEYYALDFQLGHVLFGHDGPGHPAMAESRVKLRPLKEYHGKVGRGLSVEMSVKHGPVTLLSIAEDREHGFKFVVAEGESVPGEVLRIGNTNSHYKFPLAVTQFVEAWNAAGPAHHCAIGVGHVSGILQKLASLLGIPMTRVC